jgi:hypothetical protein
MPKISPTAKTHREAWLNACAQLFEVEFKRLGHPLPAKVRYTCGWTTSRQAVGQCHYPMASRDGATEIIVTMADAQPFLVAETLLHEMIHAALGPGYGHGPKFGAIATALGMEKPWTSTPSGPRAKEIINATIAKLPPYPHAELSQNSLTVPAGTTLPTGPDGLPVQPWQLVADAPKPQVTRAHINLRCPHCDFHAKVLKDQMRMGRLVCVIAKHGRLLTAKERKAWDRQNSGEG